jgi:hypothetical protein
MAVVQLKTMKSRLLKLLGASAMAVLALVFVFSASFAAPPAANAATSTPPRAFFGPGMRGIIQEFMQEVSTLEAIVSSFAQSFTSDNITANNSLCVKKSDGTPVCITGDQLSAVLSGTGQSPSNPVQISAGSFTIANSSPLSNEGTTTSTTTDTYGNTASSTITVIVAASSTPPTSPPTDATTSAATSTSQ